MSDKATVTRDSLKTGGWRRAAGGFGLNQQPTKLSETQAALEMSFWQVSTETPKLE